MKDEKIINKAIQTLETWQATKEQVNAILPKNLSAAELNERARLILEIRNSLEMMFNNPANINGYMTMPNKHEYFEGKKPLNVIAQRDTDYLRDVTKWLFTIGL